MEYQELDKQNVYGNIKVGENVECSPRCRPPACFCSCACWNNEGDLGLAKGLDKEILNSLQ